MSKKKRPNAASQPVAVQDVFATFVQQAASMGNEVAARRRFDEDVSKYLDEKGLVGDFEAWRAKRG